ncbi:DUF3300 domain-containing protein [Comamonas sp. E6]|uniref:DUF3300 domain-containing protein n=1 Tax=Comamonas sp. E6 TaxID=364029 RepID=UPI0006379922|nr:DUF3300 domain-containing protein [Comamonas sp. E6]GAO72540.1 hypothetical protein CSE6_024_39770 [Comamonas sp. E6]
MSHFPRTRPEQPELQPKTVARLWHPGMIALAAAMALSACNDKDSPIKADSAPPASVPSATPDAAQPQPAAYVPPGADALYRMVAPIALYPDKLVAQILAGATYPDQISAAETWLGQNPGLQKTALSNAVNAQNWDPSVKSLTQFPNVLEQMASNLPWTTALGKAYYNDPSDVMNAIQVMRNRAYKAGTLKTSSQLKVNLASTPAAVAYTPGAVVTPLPDPVIEPPEQFIEISPTQVDTVYVPQYDPAAVYGQPLPVYGGYRYVEVPPPAPVAGVPVIAGLLGFGSAIVLAGSMDRHPSWGWNAWNMHWGDPERPWRHGERPPPPQARPAVVYNNTTYISQSRTVVQNIHRTDNTYINSIHENAAGERQVQTGQPQTAGIFAAQHGLQPDAIAGGATAAALAAGGHALSQRQPAQNPLATQLQGRPGFAQGPNQVPGGPRASNGNTLMPPQDPHDRHPPQAPQMQAATAEKAMQQRPQEPTQRQQAMQQQTPVQVQQQHTQEQAQRQQPMQQVREQQELQRQAQMQQQQQRAQEKAQRQQQMQQARDQQEHRQQAQLQQMQQQRAQEQAQRQQQMQQQALEQQERRQQAQMQQMQQQRAQEQAQRQQQMQQQQAREQQQRQQQAQMQQMQQMQQQHAQEQAQRQQQAREQQQRQQQAQMQQQRAQEQAQRQQQAQMQAQQHQAEQQARMQATRSEGRSRGDREHR